MMFSLVLFGAAVSAWDAVRENSDGVTVFLQSTLDNDRAEEIINSEAELEEGGTACFWQEPSEVAATCKETGKSSQVQKLVVKGNAGLLVSEAELLTWQQEGCYLDTVTAQELFGTKTAEGQSIWLENQKYTVRGTFEQEEPLMICLAEQEETIFSTVALNFADDGNLRGQTEQFLLRNGLTGDIVEFGFLASVLQNLLLLFPVTVGIKLIGLLLKSSRKEETPKTGNAVVPKTRQKAGTFLAVAGVLAAMIWMVLQYGSWPPDMIPTRWSDFSFWQNWWKRERQNIILILRSPMGAANLDMLIGMGKSALCGITATLLLFLFNL